LELCIVHRKKAWVVLRAVDEGLLSAYAEGSWREGKKIGKGPSERESTEIQGRRGWKIIKNERLLLCLCIQNVLILVVYQGQILTRKEAREEGPLEGGLKNESKENGTIGGRGRNSEKGALSRRERYEEVKKLGGGKAGLPVTLQIGEAGSLWRKSRSGCRASIN